MPLLDQYDWVVLGDHPAALLSASLAAKQGMTVLVAPLVSSRALKISSSGQYFDPESSFLTGWVPERAAAEAPSGRGAILSECFRYLGVDPAEARPLRGGEAELPQLLTPRARVSVRPDAAELHAEVERELGRAFAERLGLGPAVGAASAAADRYWRDFPGRRIAPMATFMSRRDGRAKPGIPPRPPAWPLRQWVEWRARREVLTEVDRRVRRDLARAKARGWAGADAVASQLAGAGLRDASELCSGLYGAVTQVDLPDPRLSDLSHALGWARFGASARGGLQALRSYLVDLSKTFGAQQAEGTRCCRVFVENGRLTGIQLANRGKMVGARAGVLGCALDQTQDYLWATGRGWFRSLKEGPRPHGWRFTLAVTVNADALPPGMGRRALWKERGAPALEIEVSDPEDYGLGISKQRQIFARTWLPFSEESLSVRYQRLMAARMFRQLTEVLPFLETQVLRVYPDYRDPRRAARELSEAYGFGSVDLIPENLRCIREGGAGFRSGVDRLYVASGESYPRLGLVGGWVAAVEAVADARRALKLGTS